MAEVAACGKAALFVPLPSAADNHQLKNAEVLRNAKSALVIEQKDFTVASLESTMLMLRSSPERLAELEKNVLKFSAPGAAKMIAAHVMGKDGGVNGGVSR